MFHPHLLTRVENPRFLSIYALTLNSVNFILRYAPMLMWNMRSRVARTLHSSFFSDKYNWAYHLHMRSNEGKVDVEY